MTLTAYSDHVPGQDDDGPDGLEPHVTEPIVDAFVHVVVLNLSVRRITSLFWSPQRTNSYIKIGIHSGVRQAPDRCLPHPRVLTLRSRPIVSWAAAADRPWQLITCIAALAASVGRGSLAWVWMPYQVVAATTLAPR
jgi:hypothetical protein